MSTTTGSALHDLLLEDHDEIERLCNELQACVNADDTQKIVLSWDELERRLLNHFNAEEMYLLPRLEQNDAALATQLREEHNRMRATLADLGIRCELHTIRAEDVQELIAFLRAHSHREDSSLYQLGKEKLPARFVDKLMRRLHAARP